VLVDHDPAANRFHLAGAFSAHYSGETYALSLQLDGTYADRPPVARQSVVYPGHTQAGCPDRWIANPAGWVAEANTAGGLLASLRSDSSDPDGSWARADLTSERWFYRPDISTRYRIGPGHEVGPYLFGIGPTHQVELLATDLRGADSDDSCVFRVVDTTAPAVTPPAPATVACTTSGGATGATSAPLQAFLNGATASDVADPAPAWLAPLAGGVAVSSATLFRLDVDTAGAGTLVTFRSRDRYGNLGSAAARVHVVDTVPPAATLTLSPSVLPATNAFYAVTATITASDLCGSVRVWLDSIKSNNPALDATDIVSATFGTDDRSFILRGRLAAVGFPRIYTVIYGVQDRSGNTTWLKGKVQVFP